MNDRDGDTNNQGTHGINGCTSLGTEGCGRQVLEHQSFRNALSITTCANVVPNRASVPTERAYQPSERIPTNMPTLSYHHAPLTQLFKIPSRPIYSSEVSLSQTSSISTLQVRALCPVSLQRPQRLFPCTLFD